MLPENIRSAGVINAATDPQNPPYDFYDKDNTTLIGLEQDLAAAIGQKLGVKFEFHPAQFASIIPALQAGRFDVGMSAFGDFAPREKVVDEIDYTTEATGLIVAAGNPHNIRRIGDLCGLKAAAVQGSIPLELLDKQKDQCPQDKPLEVLQFPSNDQMVLAVRSGRADAMMDTYGVAAYTLEYQVPGAAGGRSLELVKGARYAIGYQGNLVPGAPGRLGRSVFPSLSGPRSLVGCLCRIRARICCARNSSADRTVPKSTDGRATCSRSPAAARGRTRRKPRRTRRGRGPAARRKQGIPGRCAKVA
jgi:polar amino acid transport system substrate-binding protein